MSKLIILFTMMSLLSCTRKPVADTMMIHGKIITVDDHFTIAEAVAIKAGKIIAVGTTREIDQFAGRRTKMIDLNGKTVIPGLIDAHCHPELASVSEQDGEIPDVHTITELLDWIKKQAASKQKGEWIIFNKMFCTRLDDLRQPSLAELDEAAPDNPVFLDGSFGGMINSAAMKASEITKEIQHEGVTKNKKTGELTGFIRASAFKLLALPKKKALTSEEGVNALKKQLLEYNKYGITGIISGYGNFENFRRYQDMAKTGELSVRVSQNFLIPFDRQDSKEKLIDSLKTFQTITGEGDEWVRTGGLKIFLDGGILTGTAYLREPWGEKALDLFDIDDQSYRGIIHYTGDDLLNIVSAANDLNRTFTAHCTGGGGVDLLLDVFEKVNTIKPIRERRFSIIHGNFFTKESVQRMQNLGVIANCQAAWFYKDADAMKTILGEERIRTFNPFRSLVEGGVRVCGGSDHMVKLDANTSVNPFNPFLAIWSMVTRKTEHGQVIMPSESISREEALKMYTVNNAFSTFEENIKGSVEPGKLADLVVLSDDYLLCPEDQIKEIRAELTMVGGKVVFAKRD